MPKERGANLITCLNHAFPAPRACNSQSPTASDIHCDTANVISESLSKHPISAVLPLSLNIAAIHPLIHGVMAITSRWTPVPPPKSFWDVLSQGWYLGFTAFGGPPVHFKIVRLALFSPEWELQVLYAALKGSWKRKIRREGGSNGDHVLTCAVPRQVCGQAGLG